VISPAFVQTMARYNAWQNSQLQGIVDVMEDAALDLDRGAFFGSIRGTLSHLLWGDILWMSRFDPASPAPDGGIAQSVDLWPTVADWRAARTVCDGRIIDWAATLFDSDFGGDLLWYSGALARDVKRPLDVCITHFFNHQTHHRGQIHAMLTAAGQTAPVSDLVFMPET